MAPGLGWPLTVAWGGGVAAGVLVALLLRQASGWRRLMLAGGFPVSALLSGLTSFTTGAASGLPAWAWLLPLLLLLLAYPLRAWRDAPLFPTPPTALLGLSSTVRLPLGARVLDAGCGLGHGLQALAREWPLATVEGIEWSWLLRCAAGWRCPRARVRQGDMWAGSWGPYALVYLFQRPESMARALAKARSEMAPGSWLLSLDFAVPDETPTAHISAPGKQALWLYQVGHDGQACTQPRPTPADNSSYKSAHLGGR